MLPLLLGAVILFFQYRAAVIEDQKEELQHLESGIVASLGPVMRTGEASQVRAWLDNLKQQESLEQITILGRDGKPAFSDRTTLNRVNDYLGYRAFQREGRPERSAPELDGTRHQQVLAGSPVWNPDRDKGRITRLAPLKNEASCQSCHGYTEAETLGVLRLETSLPGNAHRIQDAYLKSAGVGAGAILFTGFAAFLLVRREILRPIQGIKTSVQHWRRGRLEATAPEGPSHEIGDLGSDLNRMARHLKRNFEEIKELIAQSQTGMMVLDTQGTIQFANPAAAQLMNRPQEDLVGAELGLPIVEGQNTEIEVRRGSGELGIAELSSRLIEWEGEPAHLVSFHDVTERQQAEANARYQAFHDDLTGLPNRAHFYARVRKVIERAASQNKGLAVLFLDLDRFKEVNDTLGHTAGDELLKAVAKRLRQAVRDTDLVARMSGDEFTVLLQGVADRETALNVSEKLRSSVSTPVELWGQSLTPKATIGVSLYPEDGSDTETLLKHADSAMYDAKDSGRNRSHAFATDLGEATSRRFWFKQALQDAQAKGEFRIFYQPQVWLPGGEPLGQEALLRWEHPEEGMISPADFIPLLEETGQIHTVGEWIFQQAAADLEHWDQAGVDPGPIWINVSAHQLASNDLVERMDRLAKEDGANPQRFGIELTESGVTGDLGHSVRVLNELRERGFRIAMDDFGTGYSALTFLRRLPFDLVKIDKAFVQDVTEDPETLTLVRAIIAMTHALDLSVLAEGVETDTQARQLGAEGCEYAQGFWFSRPMPRDQLTEWLNTFAPQSPNKSDRKP